MGVLEQIVIDKQHEVARSKARLPIEALRALLPYASAPRGFMRALQTGAGPHVIAEVKRASPSKGVFRPQDPPGSWQPQLLAQAYARGGAAALSVLTDVHYFWGHPDALQACRAATDLPALRKDFVIDPYQVAESRWLGADAILLIARILAPAQMRALADKAGALGMDVLIEIHDADELDGALAVPGAAIGINSRNLDTFTTDGERIQRLAAQIPADRLVVAESGIYASAQMTSLMHAGVHTFLIGERLAKDDDPEMALRQLIAGARA